MFGRGFFRGLCRCRHFLIPKLLTRFRYVGPCRCGFGPHAFYVDDRGRLVHPWELFLEDIPEEEKEKYLNEIINYLKEELRILEEKLRNIKKE